MGSRVQDGLELRVQGLVRMVYRGFLLKNRGLRRSVYQSNTRAVPVEKGDGLGMMVTGWRLFSYKLCCCSTPPLPWYFG